MAFFFRKKQPTHQQPHADWPWRLTVNGQPTSRFDWPDVVHALDSLAPDPDSFLILEQQDPADPQQYWYIQSAIATAGPHAGDYVVGCGYSAPQGPMLLERYEITAKAVLPLFAAAYQGQRLDLSTFEDHSGFLR